MARFIHTAQAETVELPNSGITVVIQEFSSFKAIKAVAIIKKIIEAIRRFGSLDEVMASFRDSENQESLDKVLRALELITTVLSDNPMMLPELVCLAVRSVKSTGGDTFDDPTPEELGNLPLNDMVELLLAVYQVNWVRGSLKNLLAKAGIRFEEKTSSTNSPTMQKLPSTTPASS